MKMDLTLSFEEHDWPEDGLSALPAPPCRKQRKQGRAHGGRAAVPLASLADLSAGCESPFGGSSNEESDAAIGDASGGNGGESPVPSRRSGGSGVWSRSCSASSSKSSKSKESGGEILELRRLPRDFTRALMWGVVRLTPKFAGDGSPMSYQVTCKHLAHGSCNETWGLSKSSSEEELLCMLKAWALAGSGLPHKDAHKAEWEAILHMQLMGELPSKEALDATPINSVEDYTV